MGVRMSGPPPNQPAQNPYYQPGYPTYPAQQFQPPYQGQTQPPPAQQYPPPTYPTYPTYPNPPANSQTTLYVHEEVVVRPARQPTVVVREERPRVGIGAGLAAMAAG